MPFKCCLNLRSIHGKPRHVPNILRVIGYGWSIHSLPWFILLIINFVLILIGAIDQKVGTFNWLVREDNYSGLNSSITSILL